jgi:hypothetical protein
MPAGGDGGAVVRIRLVRARLWTRWLTGVGPAALILAGLVFASAASAQPVNYCQVVPQVFVSPEMWGFHGGAPIFGANGTYTKGHGHINLAAHTADGIICQVQRVHGRDRQIVLSVARHVLDESHHAYMFGVEGNIMKIGVRVRSSTDRACAVGTPGAVTIFASYNNIHRDLVQYSFPRACRDHRRRYTGPSVNTNVPPN